MSVADAWVVADPMGCDICGREACEDHLPAEPARRTPPARPRLLTRAADILAEPEPDEIVEGVAYAGCVTLVPAESATGKTFVLLDLAAHVSAGARWHGRETLQGSVAYYMFEGDVMRRRCGALREVGGHGLEHVYIGRAAEPISPRVTLQGEERARGEALLIDDLEQVAGEIAAAGGPPIRLIVIDTARASMTGSEDASDAVSAYLRASRRLLAAVPGAALIIAHHAGWQDGETKRKRERGSSAWRGNVDVTLYLEGGEYDRERGEKPLTLLTVKVRDAEQPPPLSLILRRVELRERDRHGRPRTSCVIVSDRRTRADREAEQAQQAEAETRAVDRRILQVIAERPELATSQDRLRMAVGMRAADVRAAISRLVQRDWLLPPARQRQPYDLTDRGRAELRGETP